MTCKVLHDVALSSFFYFSGSQPGAIGNIWNILVVTTGCERRVYWHLMGRGQGSFPIHYNSEDSSSQQWIIQPKISVVLRLMQRHLMTFYQQSFYSKLSGFFSFSEQAWPVLTSGASELALSSNWNTLPSDFHKTGFLYHLVLDSYNLSSERPSVTVPSSTVPSIVFDTSSNGPFLNP